jgi:chromosome segregation ATPase
MVEEKSALESKVEEAHTRAEELREEVKKAAVVAQEAGRKQQHLVASNLELKQQAETAQATLRGEKELNAKLRENNRELLEEYKMLEESRNRCVEVIKMYKGQVGDLSERVEDLVTETSSKSVYLARHQVRALL